MRLLLLLTAWIGLTLPAAAQALQFRLVAENAGTPADELPLRAAAAGDGERTIRVEKTVLLDQTGVETAEVQEDGVRPETYLILLILTDAGRQSFARATRENVGRRLAIIVDGVVQSAPVLRDEISGGRAQISGRFSHREVKELVARMNLAARKK